MYDDHVEDHVEGNQFKYRGYTYYIVQDTDPESPREWDNLTTIHSLHSRYTFEKGSHDDLVQLCRAFHDKMEKYYELNSNDWYWDEVEGEQKLVFKSRPSQKLLDLFEIKCDEVENEDCITEYVLSGDKDSEVEAWMEDILHWTADPLELLSHEQLVEQLVGCTVMPVYGYDHGGLTIRTTPFSCPWDSGLAGIAWVYHKAIIKTHGPLEGEALIHKAREIIEHEVKVLDQYLTGDVFGYQIESPSGEGLGSLWGIYGYEEACEGARLDIDHYIKAEGEQLKLPLE